MYPDQKPKNQVNLTYFTEVKKQKWNFRATVVAQIVTSAHKHLQSCMHRTSNESSSYTKN